MAWEAEVIIAPVRSAALRLESRLDAKYFASPAVRVRANLSTAEGVTLRALGSYASVTMPGRLKQVNAVPGEESIPYLRPYDVFEYFPRGTDSVSATRTTNLDDYRIRAGDLLQTRSGRNLGPLTIADEYFSGFVLSDDMVRIAIDDETDRLYTLAFLRSPLGQYLLRGDLGGSVIDHISPEQVAAIQVPFVDGLVAKVSGIVREVFSLREDARLELARARASVEQALEAIDVVPLDEASPRIWTTRANGLGTRLDAAFHDDLVRQSRAKLRTNSGIRLGDVARVIKPAGRRKMIYVGKGHGQPLLSGRQLLQADVVGGKYISERSIGKDTGFELDAGSICFQADGRAGEGLGTPVLITSDRDGWLGSGHVGRVIPNDLSDSGWLWAAIASSQVQSQIAAFACGSVVDALYPEDLERILLPPRESVDSQAVIDAWGKFAQASEREAKVVQLLADSLKIEQITAA